MVFSSSIFLFVFLPVLLLVYFLSAEKYRNAVLLIASLFFYSWGEPKNIVFMLLSILVNYIFGFLVKPGRRHRKLMLVFSVVYNLGMLFVFKYLNFFMDTLGMLAGIDFNVPEILLPIGISFYTFQIMSYVIDVYKGEVGVQESLPKLALYVSLFPQLIAGPIVRYSDVEKQITNRTATWAGARNGTVRFMIGFAKKILIADQLSPLVELCFSGNYPGVYVNWVGALAYTLQIYYDFSGYSDMAIGLGELFGFHFLENFNFPYISESIQEFWRRWHISLGSWFRDYLYIPLGGSRKGTVRTYVNYLIVFFLTGLWHGASFNFIVWGLFYAFFIIVERAGFKKILIRLPYVLRHIYVLFVVVIGWVFFRAETLVSAVEYIKGMFTFSGRDVVNFNFVMTKEYAFFLLAGLVFCFPHTKIRSRFGQSENRMWGVHLCILIIFCIAIMYMVGSGYSPFLYFRF